jgi:hypothetical protein
MGQVNIEFVSLSFFVPMGGDGLHGVVRAIFHGPLTNLQEVLHAAFQ